MDVLAPFYETIYIIIVFLFTAGCVNRKTSPYTLERNTPSMLLCTFMVLFIGLRPVHPVFADMVGYAYAYENSMNDVVFTWNTTGSVLFEYMTALLASWNVPVNIYFVIISAFYFFPILMACRKLFPQNIMLAFLVFLGAFSTFSYGVNGIRAGIASSMFILALAYHERKWIVVLLLFVSWGFHHSMNMPIAALIVTLFFKNSKWYFYGWLVCLALSLAHVTYFQNLFSGFTDEKSAMYLTGETGWAGITGFRFDFLIYSAVPVAIGYLIKFRYKLSDYFYDNILNMYLVTNAAWLLCMYAGFTNRIAYLSWFLYPILIIYPFITMHPLVMRRKQVVWGHLLFTIFMMIYAAIK